MGTHALLHNNVLLTDSFVANSAEYPIGGMAQHTVLVKYDPDTVGAAIKLNVKVQIFDTILNDWITHRPILTDSSGNTLGAEYVEIVSNDDDLTAAFIVYGQGDKLRVLVKEEGSPGDFGNATVAVHSQTPA